MSSVTVAKPMSGADALRAMFDALEVFAPQLFFGRHDHQALTVEISGRTRFVKVGLSRPDFLHVLGLKAFVRGAPHAIRPDQISVSSLFTYGRTPPKDALDVAIARMLAWKGDGLHTDVEDDASITLDLGEEFEHVSIAVRNRSGTFVFRNWAITISASLDSQEWREIYDHHAYAERLFKDLEIAASNAATPEMSAAARAVVALAPPFFRSGQLVRGDFERAAEPCLSPPEIITVFNDRLFRHFFMEFTAHGVIRTFRYWELAEKTAYLEEMNAVIAQLQGLTADVCVGYGAVLSYCRSGKLFPHDDDVDILALFDSAETPTFAAALERMSNFLRGHGYRVTGDSPSHRWIHVKNNLVVDVFVGLREGDKVSFLPGPRARIAYADLFPTMIGELHGATFPLPRDPFAYLKAVYGPEWRTPDLHFCHSWDMSEFGDLLAAAPTAEAPTAEALTASVPPREPAPVPSEATSAEGDDLTVEPRDPDSEDDIVEPSTADPSQPVSSDVTPAAPRPGGAKPSNKHHRRGRRR